MTDYRRRHSPPPTPPDHDSHGPHSPRRFIRRLSEKVDFGEDVDFVVGVTASALTADQLLKQTTCKRHKVAHLAKAGLGAAVAATAFTMMSREHDQRKQEERKKKYHSRSPSRSPSYSPPPRPRGLLREEETAVARTRSPPPLSRSASVGARRTYRRDRSPDYSSDEESDYGPPYPDDEIRRRRGSRSRSVSPEPERRRRTYSHGDTRRRSRSESPGTLRKVWNLVKDGMDTYDRYDRARR